MTGATPDGADLAGSELTTEPAGVGIVEDAVAAAPHDDAGPTNADAVAHGPSPQKHRYLLGTVERDVLVQDGRGVDSEDARSDPSPIVPLPTVEAPRRA